jgi:succinate dehydrogenase/fumarate reductase flavoprotein subunit
MWHRSSRATAAFSIEQRNFGAHQIHRRATLITREGHTLWIFTLQNSSRYAHIFGSSAIASSAKTCSDNTEADADAESEAEEASTARRLGL